MEISDIYRCINIVIVFILKCYNNSFIMKLNVITIRQEAIMEIKDAKVFHDYLNGVIEGEDVKKSTKLYSNASIRVWIQVFQMIKLCMKCIRMNMMVCVMD